MTAGKGLIVLMGSGELTATMVEVHKEILGRLGASPKAVFLDTPAGFQLNADQISERAVEYFREKVGYPMTVSSFKSKDIPALDAEEAFRALRESDYVLVGPGSPTYAIRQWRGTPVPEILQRRIDRGGCLVAASAAALTVGTLTLPVYEIYKVGEDLHWVEGLDILGHFGLNLVVIPHWNNAEGGTHDTRFCFTGEGRFAALASMLPPETGILGVDEHTACLIDFEGEEVSIRGIGNVTLRRGSRERVFSRGDRIPLALLRSKDVTFGREAQPQSSPVMTASSDDETGFWDRVHALEETFQKGLAGDVRDATNALLELDRTVWTSHLDRENPEFISQAREIFREFIALLGNRLAVPPLTRPECLAPLVEGLLGLRESFRADRRWHEADMVRDVLRSTGVEVEDTPSGARWRLSDDS